MKFKFLSRQTFSITILIIFAIWGTFYLKEHLVDLNLLSNISSSLMILLYIFAVIKLIILGLFTKIIVSSLGIHLKPIEWFGLSAISTMGNYLTPFRGGAALRGTYLKAKHGMSVPLFLSTLTILYLISFATNSFIGLIAMGMLWKNNAIIDFPVLLFLALCFVSPFIFLTISKAISKKSWKWEKYINDIFTGWQQIVRHPKILFSLIINAILNTCISLLLIHFSYLALGQNLPLENSVIAAVLFLISGMVPITPAGLGIAEFALVVSSNTLGIEGSISVMAAVLNRIVIATTSIILGPIFSYCLSKQTSSN